jgi:hypothetical protein
LRERFRSAGPDALSDYELLEMALFAALPRRITKPLAKALLKKFGSFAEVIMPSRRLREVDGVGDASINQLKLIAAAANPRKGALWTIADLLAFSPPRWTGHASLPDAPSLSGRSSLRATRGSERPGP